MQLPQAYAHCRALHHTRHAYRLARALTGAGNPNAINGALAVWAAANMHTPYTAHCRTPQAAWRVAYGQARMGGALR